tara:strand:+ start:10110 stop:10406 length:297 start_codon:yes stop_codon:yes gene_type:complete
MIRKYKIKEGLKVSAGTTNWLRDPKDYAFYNSRTWRAFSKEYKQRHPSCQDGHCTRPSYYTDHIRPISEGGEKYDYNNLQALCKQCNASKTGKQGRKK